MPLHKLIQRIMFSALGQPNHLAGKIPVQPFSLHLTDFLTRSAGVLISTRDRFDKLPLGSQPDGVFGISHTHLFHNIANMEFYSTDLHV